MAYQKWSPQKLFNLDLLVRCLDKYKTLPTCFGRIPQTSPTKQTQVNHHLDLLHYFLGSYYITTKVAYQKWSLRPPNNILHGFPGEAIQPAWVCLRFGGSAEKTWGFFHERPMRRCELEKRITWKNLGKYHFFGQLWLVLGVKLMEINSNWY